MKPSNSGHGHGQAQTVHLESEPSLFACWQAAANVRQTYPSIKFRQRQGAATLDALHVMCADPLRGVEIGVASDCGVKHTTVVPV
jgi:hypothetical protein